MRIMCRLPHLHGVLVFSSRNVEVARSRAFQNDREASPVHCIYHYTNIADKLSFLSSPTLHFSFFQPIQRLLTLRQTTTIPNQSCLLMKTKQTLSSNVLSIFLSFSPDYSPSSRSDSLHSGDATSSQTNESQSPRQNENQSESDGNEYDNVEEEDNTNVESDTNVASNTVVFDRFFCFDYFFQILQRESWRMESNQQIPISSSAKRSFKNFEIGIPSNSDDKAGAGVRVGVPLNRDKDGHIGY